MKKGSKAPLRRSKISYQIKLLRKRAKMLDLQMRRVENQGGPWPARVFWGSILFATAYGMAVNEVELQPSFFAASPFFLAFLGLVGSLMWIGDTEAFVERLARKKARILYLIEKKICWCRIHRNFWHKKAQLVNDSDDFQKRMLEAFVRSRQVTRTELDELHVYYRQAATEAFARAEASVRANRA